MIRETAIHVDVQAGKLATESFEEWIRKMAAHTVSAVEDDPEPGADIHILINVVEIGLGNVQGGCLSFARAE
jgi:hypothetical protein